MFWDHDNPIPHRIEGMVRFHFRGEWFDYHIIPNAGVLIDNRALNIAISSYAQG